MINLHNESDKIDLFEAIRNNDIHKVNQLIKDKVNINCRDENLSTPLHVACIKNKYVIAKILLKNGANPNVFDGEGRVPLFYLADSLDLNSEKEKNELEDLFLSFKKHGADFYIKMNNINHPNLFQYAMRFAPSITPFLSFIFKKRGN